VGGVWLERWLREQKTRFSEDAHKPLTKEQKEKLLSLGVKPGVSQAELAWRQQYGEAEEFYQKYGNLSIPKQYMARNGKNLGLWLQRQREGFRKGKLSGWQVSMLNGIGMVWEIPNAWDAGFSHAKEYFKQKGNLNVPNAYVCPDGYRLGKWISNQRSAYRASTEKRLAQMRIQQLEELGMVWNAGQGRRVEKGNRQEELSTYS
ncbi:MAG: helicase associated domain-containing protein, partial [Lachnospiraceae bacterium]|nr:helicase associated domain-containing protein [Lachnospiraceae bacterium]